MLKSSFALLATGSLAVISACASDAGESTGVSVATSNATQTVPPTSETTTSPPPPTDAPTTTLDETDGAIDAAASTIWGLHLFAERPSDDVVQVVSDRLGAPTTDTGFLPMPEEFACTGKESYRVARWGDLRMTFGQGYTDPTAPDVEPTDSETMIAWSVGDDVAAPLAPTGETPEGPEPTGITTAEGVGIGSDRAELQAAFGDAILGGGDERVSVYVPDAGGAVPVATAFVFDGDTIVGIGAGAPDCLDPDEER